ncbi:MAG: sulfotransferase, partial [Acidimicrobiia bacterium]
AHNLYRAIGEAADADMVIDSSKQAQDAALLHLVPGIDPFFLHLVRDPRAVAFSRSRNTEDFRERGMASTGSFTSARNWLLANVGAELVRRRNPGRCVIVRYEDFAAHPREVVKRVVSMFGDAFAKMPFPDEQTVELAPRHTLKGNPSRFKTGRLVIRTDDEWKRRQSSLQRAVVTGLTFPFLHRYGYPFRPRRSDRSMSSKDF